MGKGGSTTATEIPFWLEDAAQRNLNQADRISRIGAVTFELWAISCCFFAYAKIQAF